MTTSDMKNKIVKYLPPFIEQNEDVSNLISVIAKYISEISEEIKSLSDCDFTGRGLKLQADEFRIFYSTNDTDVKIQDRLKRRYEILCGRGSAPGIIDDLTALLGEKYLSAEFKALNECGIIEDVSYIGVDEIAIEDLGKSVIIRYNGNINKDIIRKSIVPIDVNIIYENVI